MAPLTIAILLVAATLGALAWFLASLTRLGLVTPALFGIGVFVTLMVEVWLLELLK